MGQFQPKQPPPAPPKTVATQSTSAAQSSQPVDAEWLLGIRKTPHGYVVVMHRKGNTTVVSTAPGRLEHVAVELKRTLARLMGGM